MGKRGSEVRAETEIGVARNLSTSSNRDDQRVPRGACAVQQSKSREPNESRRSHRRLDRLVKTSRDGEHRSARAAVAIAAVQGHV